MKPPRWLALSAIALVSVALAACSPSTTSTPTDKPATDGGGSSKPAEPGGNLTVWVMGDSSAHFDQLVDGFEKETGATVETVAIPWDAVDQKFTTAVASGEGPDLIQIGLSKLRTYADSGALMTLDEATVADYPNLAASNFIDGVAGDATAVEGKVVSMPWVSDTRVLFVTIVNGQYDQMRLDAVAEASQMHL